MVAHNHASPATVERLKRCNILVAGGSGDSVATGAAALRLMAPESQVHVVTPNPNWVSDLEPERWPRNSRVVIVGVAVARPKPDVTLSFVQRLYDAGHSIEAIIDEHSRSDWERVMQSVGVELSTLAIEPESQQGGTFRSSGAVLKNALDLILDFEDSHIDRLLHVAELCDSRDFDLDELAQNINAALKNRLGDPRVRTHLITRLSQSLELTRTAERWVREYRWILRRHRRILANAEDLGDGLLRLVIDGPVDMNRLTKDALSRVGVRVLVMHGEFFDAKAGKKLLKIAFSTNERLELLTTLRQGHQGVGGYDGIDGVSATGYERKPMVMAHDEQQAVEIIRRSLRGVDVEEPAARRA